MENDLIEDRINSQAIEKFKSFTNFKNSRKTIFKMYFSQEGDGILNKEDKEEVFFLYNLLEDLR